MSDLIEKAKTHYDSDHWESAKILAAIAIADELHTLNETLRSKTISIQKVP